MRPFARAALTATALLVAAGPTRAQTNDHLFRSWSFSLEPLSPRTAAVAGAMDASADDAIAAARNPAALSTLHKSEVLTAAGFRTSTAGPLGDTRASRLGLAFAGGTRRLSRRLTAGAYVAQPHSMRLSLGMTELPDGLHDEGSIDTAVTEAGVALACPVGPKLHVGGRLAVRHLSLQGQYSRGAGPGSTDLRVGTSADTAAAGGAAGLLWLPWPSLRAGLVAETGRGWRVRRNATSPPLGVVLDPGSSYELKPPSRLSAGLSWRPSRTLTVFGQVDRIKLAEIQARLAIAQGAYARTEYDLDDAWEAAFGTEISVAFRQVSFQLRAGARRRAPDTLRYTGTDAVAHAAFAGSRRRTSFAAGAGVFLRRGLHADVSVTSGEGTTVLAGAGLQF